MKRRLVLLLAVGVLTSGNALAQQPVEPLPKVGGCPPGYSSSGSYCMQSSSGSTRGAIEKTGNSCRWPGTAPATTALRDADCEGVGSV